MYLYDNLIHLEKICPVRFFEELGMTKEDSQRLYI